MSNQIDVRGLSCPQPVLLTKKALADNPEKLQIVADNDVAVENISYFCKKQGYKIDVTEDGEEYQIIVSK